jgi:hypothetical protein
MRLRILHSASPPITTAGISRLSGTVAHPSARLLARSQHGARVQKTIDACIPASTLAAIDDYTQSTGLGVAFAIFAPSLVKIEPITGATNVATAPEAPQSPHRDVLLAMAVAAVYAVRCCTSLGDTDGPGLHLVCCTAIAQQLCFI